MIIKTMTCELLVDQFIEEDVSLGYKNNPKKLIIRINSTHNDREKQHQMNVKVKVDKKKEGDGFLIAINQNGTINTDVTLREINKKKGNSKYKDTCSDFDNYYEFTAGALYYGRKELKEFADNERRTLMIIIKKKYKIKWTNTTN